MSLLPNTSDIFNELREFNRAKKRGITVRPPNLKVYTEYHEKDWEYICKRLPGSTNTVILEQVVSIASCHVSYLTRSMMSKVSTPNNQVSPDRYGGALQYRLLDRRKKAFYFLKEKICDRVGENISDSACLLVAIAIVAKYLRWENKDEKYIPQGYNVYGPMSQSRGVFNKKVKRNGSSAQLNISLGVALESFFTIANNLGIDLKEYGQITRVLEFALRETVDNLTYIDKEMIERLNERRKKNTGERLVKLTCMDEILLALAKVRDYVKSTFSAELSFTKCVKLSLLLADKTLREAE